ncbi:flagellar biosynthesis protein FlhB [Paenalcaligenes niemegkensis]|uniref:flagellar biosynthesis protein FlhB n=1 Tax=Paenalcaligenes niemegkensis TaxID=2895469 RepID=UPI001EE96430|nr:flagellar biosynthesis protein FlhB [Paenalcaligenes niemegkensis]MCQ9615976.1 flagellar biosynthesis protein FlhB [Paenalcaligenes niemegkensis]
MAEDSDLEKTEPASPRRLEKAREDGQVARSRELGTFLLLAVGVATLWLSGGFMFRALNGVMRNSMWFDPRVGRESEVMVANAAQSVIEAVFSLFPLFIALFVTAIMGSALLGGFMFSWKSVEPKFEKLNPLKGVKRMFSAQTLIELLKALAKAGLIGSVAVMVIWHFRDEMISLMHVNPTEALIKGMGLIALSCGLIVSSLLLIVLIDVPWQLFSFHKKMRMSKQDMKEEHKESEGDPYLKSRIRSQQRSMAQRRMMSEVPTADVIITNPTHYAVALRYAEGEQGAPRVVAKGTGIIAQRIKEVAAEHRVPTLESPSLARALHAHVDLGLEIPLELYSAVAEVLAWVFQLRNWNQGIGDAPSVPSELIVPAGFDPLQPSSS